MEQFIAPVATRFPREYPEVSLDFQTDTMIDPVDPVHEGFDLSIMPTSPPDSTLIRQTLPKWHYLLCCAPAYLETHPTPHSPADLADHNGLLYAHAIYRDEFHSVDPAGTPMNTRVSGNLVTASITVMREAAAAGLGFCLCPSFVVSDLLASGVLVPLLPDYRTQELKIVALSPLGDS